MIDLHAIDPAPVSVPISRALFPVPFETGLEYAAPARGPWLTTANGRSSVPPVGGV